VDTAFWPATKLIRALRAKRIDALELLDLYAARIARHDRTLNSLCVLDLDAARKRARRFDRASGRARAKTSPLAGLPMTVKESFDIKGHPTTWGLAGYKNTRAASNAAAVERFARAGANVFGKSNVPTPLADWETNNPVYGKTVNPWDTSRSGSSASTARSFRRRLTRSPRTPAQKLRQMVARYGELCKERRESAASSLRRL
jgi:amidase